MYIHGIKEFRLLAQQPVALLPGRGVDVSSEQRHFLEVTFENNAVLNIPITKSAHDVWIAALREQGVSIEQRVSARGSVALPAVLGVATQETFIPVGRPMDPEAVEKALRAAAAAEEEASPTSLTIPATPWAKRSPSQDTVEVDTEEVEPPTPKEGRR
jgi:hypothetical protein